MAPGRKAQSGGGESSNPPQKEIQVRIDPDLLNCSICFHPLCSPVNQCNNGHVACPSCWLKLKHKCHICKAPVVSRNIALDKILESVHVPCTYANLGCSKSVLYSQMQMHTDTCEFGPSLCPIWGCAHKAFSGEWCGHFLEDHRFPHCEFIYGQSCTIKLYSGSYFSLFGPDKKMFLLVNKPVLSIGIALSLYDIDPPHQHQKVFSYELTVCPISTRSVKLKSQVVSIKEWKEGEVSGSFLLVPLSFSSVTTTNISCD